MYHVEIYVRVRRACMVEGMSVREASRVFGLHRDTVRKMLAYSAPPGYRRQSGSMFITDIRIYSLRLGCSLFSK